MFVKSDPPPTPIPATEAPPGAHPGAAIVSVPSSVKLAPGPVKVTLGPSGPIRVNAEGRRFKLYVTGATTYCSMRWLPLPMDASDVISSACAPGGLMVKVPLLYRSGLFPPPLPPSTMTPAFAWEGAVMALMRTHLYIGPWVPDDDETEGSVGGPLGGFVRNSWEYSVSG